MSPPVPPSDDPESPAPQSPADEIDFDRALLETEQALLMLKARYAQVQMDQQRQSELQAQLDWMQRRRDRSKAMRAELKRIQQQLEELEIALESRLFSWQGLKEVFWQAVRFGGLGIVLGWLLKSCAG